MPGAHRHAQVLLPRELGLGKNGLKERRDYIALERGVVAARPIDGPVRHEYAVRLAQDAAQMLAGFQQEIRCHRAVGQRAVKRAHVVDDDELVLAKFGVECLAERLGLVQLILVDLRIARKHHLAVDAKGVGHVERLFGHLHILLDRAVVVGVGKLDEDRSLAAWDDASGYHIAAARLRYADAHSIHLAEPYRLDRLAPGGDVEEWRLGILLLVVRVLVERTLVPGVQEVAAFRAVLKLSARVDCGAAGGRLVGLHLFAPLCEQRFGLRRTRPCLAQDVLSARPAAIAAKHTANRQHGCRRHRNKELHSVSYMVYLNPIEKPAACQRAVPISAHPVSDSPGTYTNE